MTRTAHATYPMKIAALIKLAVDAYHPFVCTICGGPILPGQRIAFDHGWAVGRGGPNTSNDIFPVHDEKTAENGLDCHTRKTAHPRGPHTAIGGDTFEAAKTDRLVEVERQHKAVMRGQAKRPASRLRSASKIPARANPWGEKGSRPMRGKARR